MSYRHLLSQLPQIEFLLVDMTAKVSAGFVTGNQTHAACPRL